MNDPKFHDAINVCWQTVPLRRTIRDTYHASQTGLVNCCTLVHCTTLISIASSQNIAQPPCDKSYNRVLRISNSDVHAQTLPFKAYKPTIELRDRKSRSVYIEVPIQFPFFRQLTLLAFVQWGCIANSRVAYTDPHQICVERVTITTFYS